MMIWTRILGAATLLLGCLRLQSKSGYNLPIFPTHRYPCKNYTIPRIVWRAVEKAIDLPASFKAFELLNPLWEHRVYDNVDQHAFMHEHFQGTSILWVYNLLNPELGAARADVWRYSALWLFGGIYIDDDSTVTTPLSSFLYENDSFVLSPELRAMEGGCYYGRSRLAHVPAFSGIQQAFVQWLIISQPRHMFLSRTLRNLVDLVTKEYLRMPDVNRNFGGTKIRWKQLVCTTGPGVYTVSIREVVQEQPPGLIYRIMPAAMFADIGGISKVFERQRVYTELMNNGSPLLARYASREVGIRQFEDFWLLSSHAPDVASYLRGRVGEQERKAVMQDMHLLSSLLHESIKARDTWMELAASLLRITIVSPKPGTIVISSFELHVEMYTELFEQIYGLDLFYCFSVDDDHFTRVCSLLAKNRRMHVFDIDLAGYPHGRHTVEANLMGRNVDVLNLLCLCEDTACMISSSRNVSCDHMEGLDHASDDLVAIKSTASHFVVKRPVVEAMIEVLSPPPGSHVTKQPIKLITGYNIDLTVLAHKVETLFVCVSLNEKQTDEDERGCTAVYRLGQVLGSWNEMTIVADGLQTGTINMIFALVVADLLEADDDTCAIDSREDEADVSHCGKRVVLARTFSEFTFLAENSNDADML